MELMHVLIITSMLLVEIGTITDHKLRIDTGDNKYFGLPNSENILCRGCGGDVSSANLIISKQSPSSLYAFNDTLFNREVVLVQVVPTDLIFQFPVITFTQSTCQGFGEWQVDDSWFPGYRWRPCICPDCGAFLGWVFETIHLGNVVKTQDEIYCLILTSLIGESCNYIWHIIMVCVTCHIVSQAHVDGKSCILFVYGEVHLMFSHIFFTFCEIGWIWWWLCSFAGLGLRIKKTVTDLLYLHL